MSSIAKHDDYPSFDGDPAKYRQYRDSVRWLAASVRTDHQNLIAPTLVRKLSGPAAELLRHQDVALYRTIDGVDLLLKTLDEHYNYLPETELQDATEDFLACKRRAGQGATEFTALFRTMLTQLERVLTDQMNRDAGDDYKKLMGEYHVAWNRFCHESAMYDRRVDEIDYADEDAVAELGEMPVAPVEPQEPAPQVFRFPSIWTGYLFLRAYGMSRQQKADTIRSAGGKTQFQAIEKVLRASEQAFEGQAPNKYWKNDKGYLADGVEDDQDQDWEDNLEYDEYDDDYDDDYDYDEMQDENGYVADHWWGPPTPPISST